LFRIIANGEIELEGEVTAAQHLRIKEGFPVTVTVGPEHIVKGQVRIVLPEIDRTTRLGRVRISLPDDPLLRIGTFARGSVEIARRQGVAVPHSAVVYESEGPSLQVVVDGKVQSRRIRTGLTADGFVEVLEGAEAGELVVTRAGSFLRHGDPVRPVLAASADAEGAL
jgi:multidrug efflux pump subunit AcrA (membrane-fusion protein)